VGSEAEPIAIAWHPYFNLPSGDRTQAQGAHPASTVAEVDNYDNVFPTGKLCPWREPVRPARPGGTPLGNNFFDDNWSHLDWKNGASP
jgi:aldose 1-epimerase